MKIQDSRAIPTPLHRIVRRPQGIVASAGILDFRGGAKSMTSMLRHG